MISPNNAQTPALRQQRQIENGNKFTLRNFLNQLKIKHKSLFHNNKAKDIKNSSWRYMTHQVECGACLPLATS